MPTVTAGLCSKGCGLAFTHAPAKVAHEKVCKGGSSLLWLVRREVWREARATRDVARLFQENFQLSIRRVLARKLGK